MSLNDLDMLDPPSSQGSLYVDEDNGRSDSEDAKPAIRPLSAARSISPRKRARSASGHDSRGHKRMQTTRFNNDYRILLNDMIEVVNGGNITESANTRPLVTTQVAGSIWTSSEKLAFFTALGTLGRDNLPGIAKAVGSKSIPEVQRFLLLIQDAIHERVKNGDRYVRLTLQDIPAALEIGTECEGQLEQAADTLARYQEKYEVEEEKKRYGDYWLITSEIADQIEEAAKSLRTPAHTLSPARSQDGDQADLTDEPPVPDILKEVPEAKLLIPHNFIELSKNLFMNPSPDLPYPWPNWQHLECESSSEPSLYRTAFRDIYTLTVSVTRRIIKAAEALAVDRIRRHTSRETKKVLPRIKESDVYSAVDLLGLERNRKQFWSSVARRCNVKVTFGKWKRKIDVPWDEVERVLNTPGRGCTPYTSDLETSGPTSDTDSEHFKHRAMRSGTPLPTGGLTTATVSEVEDTEKSKEEGSNIYEQSDQDPATSGVLESEDEVFSPGSSGEEPEGLEDFDQEASRQEEQHLREVLGSIPILLSASIKAKGESQERKFKIPRLKNIDVAKDWRGQTHYRSELEEFEGPIPASDFLANKKPHTPVLASSATSNYETDASDVEDVDTTKSKQGNVRGPELPLRGASAYAAMQGKTSYHEERDLESDTSGTEDNSEIPVPSIEPSTDNNETYATAEDAMDWERNSP